MTEYESFCLAAAPRAGVGLVAAALGGVGHPAAWLPFGASGKLRVSLVRHPVLWLLSYYKVRGATPYGLPAVDALRAVPAANVNEFLVGTVQRFPGIVWRIFHGYDADTYLRFEDLPWALSPLCGKPVPDPMGCQPGYQAQIASGISSAAGVAAHVYRRVMSSELDLVDRYGYY